MPLRYGNLPPDFVWPKFDARTAEEQAAELRAKLVREINEYVRKTAPWVHEEIERAKRAELDRRQIEAEPELELPAGARPSPRCARYDEDKARYLASLASRDLDPNDGNAKAPTETQDRAELPDMRQKAFRAVRREVLGERIKDNKIRRPRSG
jgi:hypothetical protein